MKKQTFLTILGMAIFAIGFIVAFAFNAKAVWTDLEGMSFWGYPEVTSYDHTIEGDVDITNFNCPILITPRDEGVANYSLRNRQAFVAKPIIQLHVSDPGEVEGIFRESFQVSFLPKETQAFNTTISKANNLPDNRIFIRLFLRQGVGQPPYATKHCGVLFFDAGRFSGNQLVIFVITLSSVLMFTGIFLHLLDKMRHNDSSNKIMGFLIFLGVLSLSGFILNLAGFWVISSVFLILSVLLFVSIVESRLIRKWT